jgi:plasmid maintenance system antidote protein VapI
MPKYITNDLFTIRKISPKLLDIFLNTIIGFEPQGWLRLQKRGEQWVQTSGTKVPPWKFKNIIENIK